MGCFFLLAAGLEGGLLLYGRNEIIDGIDYKKGCRMILQPFGKNMAV